MNPSPVDVSVILPVYNEADCVSEAIRQCEQAFSKCAWTTELIVVDDGSRDATPEIVSAVESSYARLQLLHHAHNLGKTRAITSGLSVARGEVIALLDADLQYDARDLVRAVELVRSDGCGAVSGWRADRQDGWDKRGPSRAYNWLLRTGFQIPIHDANCGLKAFRAEALRAIKLEGDAHRLLMPMVRAAGFQVREIVVRHYPRPRGRSKYGVLRLITGAIGVVGLRLIFTFGWNPKGLLSRTWRFAHSRVWFRIHVLDLPVPKSRGHSPGSLDQHY